MYCIGRDGSLYRMQPRDRGYRNLASEPWQQRVPLPLSEPRRQRVPRSPERKSARAPPSPGALLFISKKSPRPVPPWRSGAGLETSSREFASSFGRLATSAWWVNPRTSRRRAGCLTRSCCGSMKMTSAYVGRARDLDERQGALRGARFLSRA
jgi:hypothetical protein